MTLMESKQCVNCFLVKPLTEFNLNSTSKDGKQRNCKICCRKLSKEFRKNNPKYYWGADNSYFVKNFYEKSNYNKKYYAADKTIKLYRVDMPNGSAYIGVTKRYLQRRINGHVSDWLRFKRENTPTLPLLHNYLKDFTEQEIKQIFNSAYIVKELYGNRKDMLAVEKDYIIQLRKEGISLLNTNYK